MASGSNAAKKGKLSPESILQIFNQLRQDYTNIMTKIHELELDQNEHSAVIDALQDIEESRKCYRMIGGVLVERTVGDILPALDNNRTQVGSIIERLKQQLISKEQEMTAFKEKYNLRFKGDGKDNPFENRQGSDKTSGVLVTQEKA